MAQFTQQIDPADLVVRIHTKDGARVLDATSRQGFLICRNHPVGDSPDFEAELGELLRPFGFEGDAVAGSTREKLADAELELERLRNELAVVKSELDARRAAMLDNLAGVPAANELPPMAQKVNDGDLDQADAFVAGVLEHATRFGSHVAEQVERVCDFAARELAGIVKDAPAPTADEIPRPTPPPVAPPVPAAPPVGRRPIQGRSELTPQQRANLEALERKKQATTPAASKPGAMPTAELRSMGDRILRGEVLDLSALREFVELCSFAELDETLANAYTEAQEHLRSLEG